MSLHPDDRLKLALKEGWTFEKGLDPMPPGGTMDFQRRPIPSYETLDDIARVEELYRGLFQRGYKQELISPFLNHDGWEIQWIRRSDVYHIPACVNRSELEARRSALLELIDYNEKQGEKEDDDNS